MHSPAEPGIERKNKSSCFVPKNDLRGLTDPSCPDQAEGPGYDNMFWLFPCFGRTGILAGPSRYSDHAYLDNPFHETSKYLSSFLSNGSIDRHLIYPIIELLCCVPARMPVPLKNRNLAKCVTALALIRNLRYKLTAANHFFMFYFNLFLQHYVIYDIF